MSRFVGFLKGANKYGRWVPDADITARAIAGSSTLDFSQAIFTHQVITIHSSAFWGGVTLIVPPNVTVEQDGRAILGGFGGSGGVYSAGHGAVASTSGSGSGITIKVKGTAVMGAIGAVVNQRAKPAEFVTADEAERILREVPEEPSTTRADVGGLAMAQALGGSAAAPAAAPAVASHAEPAAAAPDAAPAAAPMDPRAMAMQKAQQAMAKRGMAPPFAQAGR